MRFTYPQKVLFKHCDPAGIVFYPRYFEIMNDCVESFFDSLGHSFENMHPAAGVPTAQISCQFKAPSRHGDQLDITLIVENVGRSSLALELTADCGGEVRFVSQSILVYIDSAGKPQAWTDELRNHLSHYARGSE